MSPSRAAQGAALAPDNGPEPPADYDFFEPEQGAGAGGPVTPRSSKPSPPPHLAVSAQSERMTMSQRALALGRSGPRVRSGIALIDRMTRGGYLPGVVLCGGAPGAGKTTLLVQLGRHLADDGVAVTILAADEGPDGLLIRLGQGLGLDRGDLEAGRVGPELVERLAAVPTLDILDGPRDGVTIEAAADELLARAQGHPAALLIDSVQRVRATGVDGASDLRIRANAVADAMKAAAAKGLIVVATSEVSRASYGDRNPLKRVDDLASFKESGSLEYVADLALVLRRAPGAADGTVDVAIAKNRWGACGAGRLVLDRNRATFAEVDLPAVATKAAVDLVARDAADLEALRSVLRSRPDGVTGNQNLCNLVPLGIGKDRKRAALAKLVDSGEVVVDGTKNRPRLRLAAFKVCRSAESAEGLPGDPADSQVCRSAALPTPFRGESSAQSRLSREETENRRQEDGHPVSGGEPGAEAFDIFGGEGEAAL